MPRKSSKLIVRNLLVFAASEVVLLFGHHSRAGPICFTFFKVIFKQLLPVSTCVLDEMPLPNCAFHLCYIFINLKFSFVKNLTIKLCAIAPATLGSVLWLATSDRK